MCGILRDFYILLQHGWFKLSIGERVSMNALVGLNRLPVNERYITGISLILASTEIHDPQSPWSMFPDLAQSSCQGSSKLALMSTLLSPLQLDAAPAIVSASLAVLQCKTGH